MLSEEEILQLRQEYHESEKRMEKIGKKQFSAVVELSEWLGELIDSIEQIQEKEKGMKNAAVIPKIKMARKGIKLSKGVKSFEWVLANALKEGDISGDMEEKFTAILKLIKNNKIFLAKREFEYFAGIVDLSRKHAEAKEELEKKDGALRREQSRIRKLLEEMEELEKETVDPGKVQVYEEYLKNLEKLEEFRKRYLHSLISKPVAELLEDMEKHSLENYSFPPLRKEKMEELKDFFSENPKLGEYGVGQFCELFNYSEKKLMHICPEISKFRRIVLSDREWFETIHNLDRTTFLAVDDGNEKVMDFYAEKIDGASGIVGKIMQLGKEKNSCREEYEKNRRIGERKKDLSKYSKNKLEGELKETGCLLEVLHSKPEEEEKEREEEQGLLSKIGSFFKP